MSQQGILLKLVQELAANVLGQNISPDQPFMAAGLDSLGALELRDRIAEAVDVVLPSTLLFDYPNARMLTGFIATIQPGLITASEPSQVRPQALYTLKPHPSSAWLVGFCQCILRKFYTTQPNCAAWIKGSNVRAGAPSFETQTPTCGLYHERHSEDHH